MKTFIVRLDIGHDNRDVEIEAESESDAIERAEGLYPDSASGYLVIGEKPMPKDETKKEMKRFMVTVHEEFSAVYSVEARDVAEAEAIVEEGFNSDAEDYSPSRDGEGYRRHIYIDPDFSD